MILTKKDIHDSIQSCIRMFGECLGYRIDGDASQLEFDDIMHGVYFKCVMKKKLRLLAGKQKVYCTVFQTRTICANHEDDPDMYVVEHIMYYEGQEDDADRSSTYYYVHDDMYADMYADSMEDYAELVAADAAKDNWLSYEDSYDNKNNIDRKHLDYILDFMLHKMKKKYCTK